MQSEKRHLLLHSQTLVVEIPTSIWIDFFYVGNNMQLKREKGEMWSPNIFIPCEQCATEPSSCPANHYTQQNNNNLQIVLCRQTAGTQTWRWGLISAWLSVTPTSCGKNWGSCGGKNWGSRIYSALRQIVIRGGKHSLKPERAHWCHSRVFVRSDQGTEWNWGFNQPENLTAFVSALSEHCWL